MDTNELKNFDIKGIALNREKFGDLIFEKSFPVLEKLRSIFVEFDELGYQALGALPEDGVRNIRNLRDKFTQHLNRLKSFDMKEDGNFKSTHDAFENEMTNFYQTAFHTLFPLLTYLRQEMLLKRDDQKDLQKLRKDAVQTKQEYEKLSADLKLEIENLRKEKQVVESKRGEIPSAFLGVQFDNQATEYSSLSKSWLRLRNIFFGALCLLALVNLFLYFTLLWMNIDPKTIFTTSYLAIKIAVALVLIYGMSFASRNYNVNAHLTAVNTHRRNVAETMNRFLSTNPPEEDRAQIVRQGTEAMFKHMPVGYISKSEQKDGNAFAEIVNNVIGGSKSN